MGSTHDSTHDTSGAPGGRETGRQVRRAFLWVSAVALGIFLLVNVRVGVDARGSSRVQSLMTGIGAEMVERPMSETQRRWALELDADTRVDLSQLPQDTLIFLNFWATWCPPCVEELPSMLRLRRALADHRFAMVAVSYDDSWDDIRSFFDRFMGGMPRTQELLVLRDPIPEGQRQLKTTFGTNQLPDTYVILNGRVLARFVNARNWTEGPIVEYFRSLAPAR